HYQELLTDGYILRWGTAADSASLNQLYGTVFGEEHETGFNYHVVNYVNGLLSGNHPLC
ncbi:MAG: GNAT family N-acetyltransferase, partial [Chloroflexi bacterium]